MKTIFLLFLFFVSGSAFAASAAGAYVVSPATGATFNASGISPAAVPFTFTPSAANDGAVAARSIPVSVQTPYGAASGTVKTAGLISKPVAASLGKSLLRLAVPIQIGFALYDAFQASQISVNPDGTVGSIVPDDGSVWCDVSHNSKCLKPNSVSPFCPSGYSFTSIAPSSVISNILGGFYSCSIGVTQYVAPSPRPATLADQDAAIDKFANNSASSSNATALASDAYKANIPMPNIGVDVVKSPPVTALTPWVDVATNTDSLGNVTRTSKQAEITFSPTLGASLNDPIPTTIKENTKTTLNATPQTTASDLVSQSASGATLPSNVSSPSSASPSASPTDCDKFPNSVGCAALGENDVPDSPLGERLIPVSLGGSVVSEAGACPAPKTFSVLGRAFTLPMTPLCDFCSGIRPFVLLCFALAAAYIFVGGVKNA